MPSERYSRGDGDVTVESLAQQFATLTASLLSAGTVGGVLRQVVEVAREVVPKAELVSVTLRAQDGQFYTPVETDPSGTDLDRLQFELREGPCLTAADETGPAVASSDDLGLDTQWPRFAPAAARLGWRSVLAVAVPPDVRPPALPGALNIYTRQPGELTELDRAATLLLATHASLALAHTDAVTRAQLESEQLHRAIDSRDVIGQAKGILMSRRGMSAADAFDLLRRTSQDLNIKLVDLAETLADHHGESELPGEHDGGS